jgi:hypothetical protein
VADHCKLLFEVGNLIYASPATVSRCGIVFVDPKNLGVEPFMWKWLNERPDKLQVTPRKDTLIFSLIVRFEFERLVLFLAVVQLLELGDASFDSTALMKVSWSDT